MNFAETENAIYEKLRLEQPSAVIDGVVCEDEYLSAPRKVMFVLKEVNGGSAWDLREFARNGARAQTWNNITRWTKGLHELDNLQNWEDYKDVTNELRKEYLNKICVVNLKKVPGGSVSDWKEILQHACGNKEILLKQIELYKPDVAVCCGTGWALYEACFKDKGVTWQETTTGVGYFNYAGCSFIDYKHPAARTSAEKLFLDLMEAAREVIF